MGINDKKQKTLLFVGAEWDSTGLSEMFWTK
jgi:hypothetical protein